MAKIELYNKYRPQAFGEVIGQDRAVATVKKLLARKGGFPHAVIFDGPSGVGKTTLARIVAKQLDPDLSYFSELNCAMEEARDMVVGIGDACKGEPLGGGNRIWILDEFQALSRAGFSQQAMLKVIEEAPDYAYFLFCTTDPNKIIATIRNRCIKISLKAVDAKLIVPMVKSIAKKEKFRLADMAAVKIAELSEGSPRKSLRLLEKAILADGEDMQLEQLKDDDYEAKGIDLCRLMFKSVSWRELAAAIRGIKKAGLEEAEKVRRGVLGYATAILLSGGPLAPRAAFVIEAFRDDWYSCGWAGLSTCCYHCVPKNRR